MSTSLVLTCPVHGADIEPFDIAGTKFCALCLRDFLAKTNLVRELKMNEVEVEVKVRERASDQTFVCNRCDRVWPVAEGRACPQCGLDAMAPAGE